MADFVFNIAKGRVAQLALDVNANTPTNAELEILVADATTTADGTAKDYDTVSAYLGGISGEVTNTGYARITLTSTSSIQVLTDDTNDVNDIDLPDQTWSAVSATTSGGNDWTDLVFNYTTASATDANQVPLTQHDFSVTPDGSDITAQFNAEGFFRAS